MTVCGGWSLVKHEAGGTRAITLWCHSWQCADCQPRRLAKLKRQAMDGCPTTFMTLTVNPQRGQSPEARARELSDALKLMIKRARRKFTKSPIEYLAVFEETKKGEPHLHILMRAPYVPQKWLSETMAELIEAPIVDIRRVGHKKAAARYVAKYVGKGPKPFGSLKRYWSTPGYDLDRVRHDERENEKDSGWRVVKDPLFLLVELWRNHCRETYWINDHEIFSPAGEAGRWRPPWEGEAEHVHRGI